VRVDDDGYLISAKCFFPDAGNPNVGYERPYFIKTDTAGNLLWWVIYGSSNGFHGFIGDATVKGSSGNFYSIGRHSNYCDTPVLVKCLGIGQESYYQDLVPGSCPGGTSSVNFLNDTTMVICGGGTLNGQITTRWMKTDTLGVAFFYKEFPYWVGNTSHTAKTFDNKFVSVATDGDLLINLYKLNSDLDYDSVYTHQFVYDSLCPGGVVSDTINPDCSLIVGIEEPSSDISSLYRLKIFPNPASSTLTVEFPKQLQVIDKKSGMTTSSLYYQWRSTILRVYDINGKVVSSSEILQNVKKLEMDVSQWDRGMYYFRLIYDKETVASEKVIIR
jgi:hypothetical protein